MGDSNKLKKCACDVIDTFKGELHELSKAIWNKPELIYEEKFAHDYLTNFLEKNGFEVERHYLGLDTAFRATFGEGKPHVAVMCEYDALPEIGHACGHNLIAEIGVASGLGIKSAMESADGKLGKLTILGTPAEEGGGGKIVLLRKGAFEDFDFCGMCHPFPLTFADPSPSILAIARVDITFKGKATHAGAFPWEGINALDAAVLAYNNISCLRQQIKPTWRVHGVILNGGKKSNIIPEISELEFNIRAPTSGEMDVFREKFNACFHAAALATGCEVTINWDPNCFYQNVLPARTLTDLFEKNGKELGIEFLKTPKGSILSGSTDMGNVSHFVPSIHPVFSIGGTAANHTRGFTDDSGADIAQKYTLDQGKALAMTAIDILVQPDLLTTINREFQEAKIADARG